MGRPDRNGSVRGGRAGTSRWSGGRPGKAPLRHHGIAAFKMAGEPLGIEQREQEAVPAQTFTGGP